MESSQRAPVVHSPGEGRSYEMGRIRAVFKADGPETGAGYSISEWWLEPDTKGPGAHSHEEDNDLCVIEGIMSVMVGDQWLQAPKGPLGVREPPSWAKQRSAIRAAADRQGVGPQKLPAYLQEASDGACDL